MAAVRQRLGIEILLAAIDRRTGEPGDLRNARQTASTRGPYLRGSKQAPPPLIKLRDNPTPPQPNRSLGGHATHLRLFAENRNPANPSQSVAPAADYDSVIVRCVLISRRLASETRHIELESGEHDLHAFQAIRRMDEVLITNFMTFQDAVEEQRYDLVIADEAWDIDHYWHEHPELKKAGLVWFTDFVGFVPMPSGGEHEAFLTADYNAEMIEHIERHPGVGDRSIFIGKPADIIPLCFGKDLPAMRDWVPKHFDFPRYVMGEHPRLFG